MKGWVGGNVNNLQTCQLWRHQFRLSSLHAYPSPLFAFHFYWDLFDSLETIHHPSCLMRCIASADAMNETTKPVDVDAEHIRPAGPAIPSITMPSRRLLAAATALVGSFAPSSIDAFSSSLISTCSSTSCARQRPPLSHQQLAAQTYGPSDDITIDQEQEEWEKANDARVAQQKVEFSQLLSDVVACTNVDHLPGIMTRKIDLLLTSNMQGFEGVAILKEAIEEAQQTGDEERIFAVESAVNLILTFAEEFVANATSLDEGNKKLLGKIVKEIISGWDNTSSTSSASKSKGFGSTASTKSNSRPGIDDEARLDALFEREKDNFTPGFLRHLEGECKRIASASRLTPESGKLLETLRMIQARVVEELGQELGEGAVVLGQLLGYDNRSERLAVLDAGLTVRGVPFAKELVDLTAEALEGFEQVPGGADPELVRILTEIDERTWQFIEKKSEHK